MALLAAYNFNESSGNILDRTGNGHDFALNGGLVRTTTGGADPTGYSGTGLTSNTGTADLGPTVFGQTANRTIAFWLRSTSTFTGWIWEWHNTAGDTGRWGMLELSGSQGFRGRNSGGTAHAAQPAVSDSAWHFWVGTYDGSNVRLYYGTTLGAGVSLIDTKALAGPILTDADVIRIFTTAGSGNIIRHVRVYDEAINDVPTLNTLMGQQVSDGSSVTLTVQDASQSHTVDSPALTQVHNLAAADAAQAQTVDALTLTQVHNLAAGDATQVQTVDSLNLTQAHNLSVGDASQAQTVDQPTLTQVHNLTVQDASQGHTADNVVLSLALTLVVADALQAQSVDSPSLTQTHVLGVPDTVQGQTADAPVLTQVHNLVVQDATHAHTVESPTLLLFGIAYLLITESGPVPLTLDGVFDGTTVAPVALESIA
jgi:hypothetical protein